MTQCAPIVVDREKFAVVVIDIQDKLAAVMKRRAETETAAALLIRAAGVFGAPVIVTRQYPKGLGDTEPAIAQALDEAWADGSKMTVVDKVAFCCSAEPAFASALAAEDRPQIVLAGMETHICVAQTALALAGQGREVFVCADACCSRRDLDNDVALARLRAAGVVVTTVESVVYEALGESGTDEFKRVLGLIR
jgi:nicotinamidase-related amidase